MRENVAKKDCMRLLATRPLILITTLSPGGVANGGAFGAYTNLSPREVGIAIGRSSHTYANIRRTGEFAMNIPGANLIEAIHIFGTDYPRRISEVEKAGLEAIPSRKVAPPSIGECVAAIECGYVKELPIGYHTFIVGELLCGWCKEEFLDKDGYLDVLEAKVLHNMKYPREVYAIFGSVIEPKKSNRQGRPKKR